MLTDEIISDKNIEYIFSGENRGYGAGHNIAIRSAIVENSDFHVVLNSDLIFEPKVIDELAEYMEKDDSIGQLSPRIVSPKGEFQYLCKHELRRERGSFLAVLCGER